MSRINFSCKLENEKLRMFTKAQNKKCQINCKTIQNNSIEYVTKKETVIFSSREFVDRKSFEWLRNLHREETRTRKKLKSHVWCHWIWKISLNYSREIWWGLCKLYNILARSQKVLHFRLLLACENNYKSVKQIKLHEWISCKCIFLSEYFGHLSLFSYCAKC